MQVVLEIEEHQKETLLNILENLKEGLIQKLKILDTNYVSDSEQKALEESFKNFTKEDKEISHSKLIKI